MRIRFSSDIVMAGIVFIIGIWLRISMLTTPFIGYHANRQIESAIIVKTFYEAWGNPFNIKSLMPEFQLLSYILASVYKRLVFIFNGEDNLRRISSFVLGGDGYYTLIAFLGRGLVIFISLCGMYFLYKLARIYMSRPGANFINLWSKINENCSYFVYLF